MGVRRIAAALVAVATLSAGLAACGGGAATSVMDKAKSDKKLTIGVKPDQPGIGLQKPDGTFAGFDIDVAKYVAEKLGVGEKSIKFVPTLSANREAFIQQGKVDMVIASYSITDERKKVISFAGPYYIAGQDILVKAGDSSIKTVDDLVGKKVCSGQGSASSKRIEDKFGSKVNLIKAAGYGDCLTQLLGGQVQAMTTDNTILSGYSAQNPGKLKLVGAPFSQEKYGIGLKKDDKKGRDAINNALQQMFTDGSWKRFLEQNLPGVPAETPPTLERY